MMDHLYLLLGAALSGVAALASLAGLYAILRQKRSRQDHGPALAMAASPSTSSSLPYRRVEALLTPSERAFLHVLRPIAEQIGADVFAKVRLDDLIQVRKGTPEYHAYRERIGACGIDFLLCDRQRLVPLLGFMVEGIARDRSARREREQWATEALAAVGLAVVHVPARAHYDSEEIGTLIQGQIAAAAAPALTPGPARADATLAAADLQELRDRRAPAIVPDASAAALMPALAEPAPDAGVPTPWDTPPAVIIPALCADPPQAALEPPATLSARPAATEQASAASANLPASLQPDRHEDGGEAAAAGGLCCPECGQPLLKMQDVDTGEVLLACSRYPECQHVEMVTQSD